MPVILPRSAEGAWLQESDVGAALSLLDALPAREIARVPVSSAVNDVRYDGPDCIEPVELPPDEPAEPSLF